LTPSQFYQRTNQPLVVVNGTFFSFETNNNLNVVIKDGEMLAHNAKTYRSKKDTLQWLPSYSSAIGITKRRRADIAWIRTDSIRRKVEATQMPYGAEGNFFRKYTNRETGATSTGPSSYNPFSKWKMRTAIGGGPVLIQAGEIKITNEQERMFAGKAINDKHPRTAMGYTAGNKLIILVIEGRNYGIAHGATLGQEAQILKDLGCVEALNLDGGGSSCLLINGKETIKPSDKDGQRAVPAVFLIKKN
jgi:exopolysaccharide biosynthesis protein